MENNIAAGNCFIYRADVDKLYRLIYLEEVDGRYELVHRG